MTSLLSAFQNPKTKKNLLLGLLWFFILVVAWWLRAILLPFFLAALIAYILDPLIRRITKWEVKTLLLPRWAAVLIIYLIVIAILSVFLAFFLPEIYSEVIKLGRFLADQIKTLNETHLQEFSASMQSFFERNNIPVHMVSNPNEIRSDGTIQINLIQLLKDMLDEFADFLTTQSSSIMGQMQAILAGLFKFVFQFFLVLMISGFILTDTERVKLFLFKLVSTEDRGTFDALLGRIDKGLSGVVRGQLMICLVNGILTLIGLFLLDIKFAFILATMAAILSFVPIFGSIISTIPIAVVALTISPLKALLALAWIVGIHALEANFLNPKILGQSAKIHPVLIVLSLIAGEHYYGIAGAVLAVPITSIILTIFQSVLNKAHNMDMTAIAK